ncbi:MAG: hypothetical protein ACXAEX_16095 [Promethearchaeota archaeon]
MVEITYQMVLSTLQTVGLLVGIFYYIMTLRNTQKNRMKEMVFQRVHTRTPDYFRDIYDANPSQLEWNTVEEFHRKHNWRTTPDLIAKRSSIFAKLNAWGFLLREGLIDLDFLAKHHNPSFIKSWWEYNEPIFLDSRKRTNNPEAHKDFEFLYNAVKKKYPNIKPDTLYNPNVENREL